MIQIRVPQKYLVKTGVKIQQNKSEKYISQRNKVYNNKKLVQVCNFFSLIQIIISGEISRKNANAKQCCFITYPTVAKDASFGRRSYFTLQHKVYLENLENSSKLNLNSINFHESLISSKPRFRLTFSPHIQSYQLGFVK